MNTSAKVSGITIPQLSKKEWVIHSIGWLVGLVIINWPGNEITVGVFRNTNWGLLVPSIYGTLANAFLVYWMIQSIAATNGAYRLRLLLKTVVALIVVSLIESLLDLLFLLFSACELNTAILQEIGFGNLLMNFFLFYIPSWVYGVIKVANSAQNEKSVKIAIQDGYSKILVAADELHYLESDGNYVKYHLSDRIVLERSTLSNVEEKLPPQFIRCHKSFIINSGLINQISANELKIGRATVPIGRKYKSNLDSVRNK